MLRFLVKELAWTLLTSPALEVSYCEASCALGGGEEVPWKQNASVNDSVAFSELC